MSRNIQEELELLIAKINDLPAIQNLTTIATINRLKTNLVEAGDKVNRPNDCLLEQLRKFVEQKSLLESKRILHSLELIEALLMEYKDTLGNDFPLLTIDGLFKPSFLMERPLFRPPVKVVFQDTEISEGESNAETNALYEQFFIDIQLLYANI